jgi:hypothetical protein
LFSNPTKKNLCRYFILTFINVLSTYVVYAMYPCCAEMSSFNSIPIKNLWGRNLYVHFTDSCLRWRCPFVVGEWGSPDGLALINAALHQIAQPLLESPEVIFLLDFSCWENNKWIWMGEKKKRESLVSHSLKEAILHSTFLPRGQVKAPNSEFIFYLSLPC